MIEIVLAVFLHAFIVLKCVTLKDRELHGKPAWWSKWYMVLAVAGVLALLKHPGKI